MNKHFQTGIIEIAEPFLFIYADNFETLEEAKKHIELFKEQHLKANVKTIEI